MGKKVFLFKLKSEDRDCVAYVDIDDIKNNRRDIVGSIIIQGACYVTGLKNIEYEDISYCQLTKRQFESLKKYNEKDFNNVLTVLLSEENDNLFQIVIEEEKEFMGREYNLTEEEIEEVLDNYYGEFKDRGIISRIYNYKEDIFEELIEEGAMECDKQLLPYINIEEFVDSVILNDEIYYELYNGLIVCYNY